jgi:ABC-2 type transport system permease protein
MGFAALGAALAISNIFTVVAPYPMDKRPGNPMRQAAQGYSFYQVLGVFGSVGGTAIAVLPLIFATVLSNADPAAIRMPVLLLCGAAYGFVLALAGVRIAALAAERRLPELAQIAILSKL